MTREPDTRTRHFYTDPLAAAWMAKHFGMRFDWQIDGKIAGDDDHGGHGWELDDQLADITNRFAERYYIQPDSLHLLEPILADVVAYTQPYEPGIMFSRITKVGYADWKGDVKRKIHARARDPKEWERCYQLSDWDDWNCKIRCIIQRGGNHFFWPEVGA